jgi:catechol 2,3-dioxygenase-like lactoylglutathione lyase family enzyme
VAVLANVTVDCLDPPALARFWSRLLGWPVVDEDPEVVSVRSPGGLDLDFAPVQEPKRGQNRIHLDLASDTPAEQLELVERAVELGARHADVGQDGVPWVVLADPEGNEFCVLEPRETYRETGRIAAVVVSSPDPRGAARFWSRALDLPVAHDEEGFTGLRIVPGLPALEFLPGPAKSRKDRLHLDLRGADQDETVAALLALGARRVDVGQGDVSWVVLADPDGGELCVLADPPGR